MFWGDYFLLSILKAKKQKNKETEKLKVRTTSKKAISSSVRKIDFQTFH
jgi:hypothetical protein